MVRLGVDIGGTKTRAVAVDDQGRELADVTVGSASVQAVGAAAASVALHDLARVLTAALGDVAGQGDVAAQVEVIAAGAAGIDTPEHEQRLAGLLNECFPAAAVRVVHDTKLLLAAAHLSAGCVLIAGTGSAAWAINPDGLNTRVGGWGWLLGDEGCAFGVVKSAVQEALSDLDQAREPSVLTRELLAAVGVERPIDLLGAFYERPGSRYWGAFAPAVIVALRAGCPRAQAVLDGCLDAAAHDVQLACRRVDIDGPVVLAGGFVANVPEVADGLIRRLESVGLHEVSVLRREPVCGAVDLAMAMTNQGRMGGDDA